MKKSIAALVIATGLLLTGCSQVNEAASIGDRKITQSDLQASVDSILEERTKVDTSQMQLVTGQDMIRGQLRFKILIQIYDAIAEELQLKVTNADEVLGKLIRADGSNDKITFKKPKKTLEGKGKKKKVNFTSRATAKEESDEESDYEEPEEPRKRPAQRLLETIKNEKKDEHINSSKKKKNPKKQMSDEDKKKIAELMKRLRGMLKFTIRISHYQ